MKTTRFSAVLAAAAVPAVVGLFGNGSMGCKKDEPPPPHGIVYAAPSSVILAKVIRLPARLSRDLRVGTSRRRYVVARLATQANPRRLTLSANGRTLVVANHLADSLTVIDAGSLRVLRHIPLGGPAPDAPAW